MPQAGRQPPTSGSPRRLWGRLRLWLVLMVGIGVGTAISTGMPGRALEAVNASSDAVVPAATPRFNDVPAAPLPTSGDAAVRPGGPADAVGGFLAAEADGRFTDAFAFLSATDQAELGGAAGYVAAHADLLPPVRGFAVEGVEEHGDTATVITEVAFEPSLDEVAGLVPGEAAVTWTAVAADEGWAVELTSAEMAPRYPAEEQAAQDVAEWVAARQACQSPPPALEHSPLRGVPALADDLCGADAEPVVGEVEALAETDAAGYLAAYGGEVASWARVIEVGHAGGPVDLRAVVAPIGDRWSVIGVLAPEIGA